MNICAIEMYLVFKKLTKLPPRFEMAHTLPNLTYVFCLSIFFVIINVVLSFILSKGQEVGYGGTLCYLSSPVLQTITFVIPSAAAVVSNIVLFALVVINISAASIGSANLNQERNYLGIYTRLSSILGLTWIFGFLQLLIGNDILDYMFIVLNASQGVFIMMAFVMNKRTLTLYCKTKERQKTGETNSIPIDNMQ
ncbi:MAG: 7 transmembrane receptor [Candidatus Thiodiazotropha sp.]